MSYVATLDLDLRSSVPTRGVIRSLLHLLPLLIYLPLMGLALCVSKGEQRHEEDRGNMFVVNFRVVVVVPLLLITSLYQ